jgi:putative glutathione S-transferase
MARMINGVLQEQWLESEQIKGTFEREESVLRDWITADGSSRFPAEPRRYHLYVSLACPWASRTLIFRKLKKLEHVISLSIVDPHMGEQGWEFSDRPGCIPDTANGLRYLHQVYTLARPDYTGQVTVPVLWDKKTRTIVNNESSEIIRMFNSAFDAYGDATVDFYPVELRGAIDAINAFVYEHVNDGVYEAGFATSQKAYEDAFDHLFYALDELDRRLSGQRYLVGDRLTEADWRLFTTLVRFDAVYYSHFKCNLRRLIDYPHLWAYTRELYQVLGVAETVNMSHIKEHYYTSHDTFNPTRIVPKGPAIHFAAPHGRDRLKA